MEGLPHQEITGKRKRASDSPPGGKTPLESGREAIVKAEIRKRRLLEGKKPSHDDEIAEIKGQLEERLSRGEASRTGETAMDLGREGLDMSRISPPPNILAKYERREEQFLRKLLDIPNNIRDKYLNGKSDEKSIKEAVEKMKDDLDTHARK